MVDRERKLIPVKAESIDIEDIKLGKLLQKALQAVEQYGPDAVIEKRLYEYEDGYYFAIMTKRYENDDEYNRRIAREEHYEKQNDAHNRALYEQLKKKYGE